MIFLEWRIHNGSKHFKKLQKVTYSLILNKYNKSYQTNESFQRHFFDNGLEMHDKRFSRTNDALVIQNNNLEKKSKAC